MAIAIDVSSTQNRKEGTVVSFDETNSVKAGSLITALEGTKSEKVTSDISISEANNVKVGTSLAVKPISGKDAKE